ncbi:hypothetical protein I7I50_09175 [Histoplasma capsulatum G186AR]|uniref:Uncharacterized protein n=1 Tax=Ajellomyces capsulatus TaxID=5037 RepID=A0A8H7YU20_AJECA|nr:hypothetical protein I7I52_06696 [Histoplasma capsulatum]QSS74123.1 hypothetical protein I7I50_09175 [Histoplasma capsulatum G186AR]
MVCRSAWLALDSISMAPDKNPQPRTKTNPFYMTRDREKREMKELEKKKKKKHRNTDEGSGRIRPLKRGILFIYFFSFLFPLVFPPLLD